MAVIYNLHGVNYADGTNEALIINYYGVFRSYNSGTGNWDNEGKAMTSGYWIDSDNFLDHAFFVNGNDSNLSRDSNGTYSEFKNLIDSPVAKYVKAYKTRLYLGNIKINDTWYRSRVWYSDLPKNGEIRWGLETGTNLAQTAGSAVVTSAGSIFSSNNIKTGDPITIETGANAGQYTVRSIDSETQLTLTETLSNTVADSTFWVGGNWFDVNTDDGDTITGFGRNSNELVVFKRLSLHRFNVLAGSLRQVKETSGTGSFRSIIDQDEYTYYYDPASDSIKRFNGTDSTIISSAIEDLLENISSSNRDNVVGWVTKGKIIEFYIGDTETRDGDSITDCVLMFDTITETWSTRSIPWVVDYSGEWVQSGKRETYIGTQDSLVLKVNSGYQYNTTDIGFEVTDRPIFPEGEDAVVEFQRLRLLADNGLELQVMYRLIYEPVDDRRWTIGEWYPLQGKVDADKVELYFSNNRPRRACGIQFKFIQSSGVESFLIEEYVVYYSNVANR